MEGRVERLARILSERGAVLTGRFVLSSGRVSSIYLDLRLLLGDSKAFREALQLLDEVAPKTSAPIVGVATGGIAWAVGLSLLRGVPSGYVRVEVKGHGAGRRVEGAPPKGPLIIVDDVATTGKSLSKAIEAARSEGYDPIAAVVLVDREEGASDALERLGVRLYSVARLSEILEVLGIRASLGTSQGSQQ